ncbi:putative multidrug ABC transporter ATP-binding protein YbhF [Thermoflexales bacterium]|nr:putative multidrug ABC transporter ATP-binding protein YbhF [Thermoflexales bacterium]
MTEDTFAIQTEKLSKRFGHFVAVNSVTFNVRRGTIFGFLGPNGAGKTTTMRMLLGLLRPSGGKAKILGYDVAHQPRAVKKRIGYMSQRFSLYDDLTVEENLLFFGRTYGLRGARLRERIQYALRMADLIGREQTPGRELAGGFRQRMALGAAILHDPELIFLDEPTAGVDPVSRRSFWELLYQLVNDEGVTIFVTTHYMDEAEQCQELAFIHGGQIVAQGSPADLKVTLMRGVVIELTPDDPPEAMRLLKEASAAGALRVDDIALYGAQIHLVAQDAAQAQQQLAEVLTTGGVQFDPPDVIRPSLEDVFLSAIR